MDNHDHGKLIALTNKRYLVAPKFPNEGTPSKFLYWSKIATTQYIGLTLLMWWTFVNNIGSKNWLDEQP